MTDIVERLREWGNTDSLRLRRWSQLGKPEGKLLTEDIAEAADEIERLREELQRIVQWAEAYPLDIFPEPDFDKAHKLLTAGGMTLDAISASCMRHVVEGVGRIAREALK